MQVAAEAAETASAAAEALAEAEQAARAQEAAAAAAVVEAAPALSEALTILSEAPAKERRVTQAAYVAAMQVAVAREACLLPGTHPLQLIRFG